MWEQVNHYYIMVEPYVYKVLEVAQISPDTFHNKLEEL